MKIVHSNVNSWMLSSIAVGGVFEYDNALYLKTDEFVGNKRVCVRLGDGHIGWFDEECFIYKSKAKVVLE